MIIKYDTCKLTDVLNDISRLTGISISVLDVDYNTVATNASKQKYCMFLQSKSNQKEICSQCDNLILKKCTKAKKPAYHLCRFGLYDFAMPITKDDIIVGYIMMGQIRSDKSPKDLLDVPVSQNDLSVLKKLYKNTAFISKSRLNALYNLLPVILFNNLIQIVHDPLANSIAEFIDKNINIKITVDLLCSKFYISKNHLYDIFRKNFDASVTTYINTQKINFAKKLISETTDSLYKIAEKAGFDNYAYFSRLFKKHTGLSPIEFKNNS